MERKLIVFISSNMNKEVEDLDAERQAAKGAITETLNEEAWLFEHTPASDLSPDDYYLQAVDNCDLFVLILGKSLRPAVEKEFDRAFKKRKPILAFIKSDVVRDRDTEHFINEKLAKKWAKFASPDELRRIVAESVIDELHRVYRNNQKMRELGFDTGKFLDKRFAPKIRDYLSQLESQDKARTGVAQYLLRIAGKGSKEVTEWHYIPLSVSSSSGEATTLEQAFRTHGQIVLLGEPGSGKTTVCQELLRELSAHASAISPREASLPVWVPLREAHVTNAVELITVALRSGGLQYTPELVVTECEEGKLAVIFDGLDELPESQQRAVSISIGRFARLYPNVRLVLTCRSNRSKQYLFPVDSLTKFELKELEDSQVCEYCSHQLGRTITIGELYSWPSNLRSLAKRPLWLSMIVMLFGADGRLPSNLAELLDRFCRNIFEGWERQRGSAISYYWKSQALNHIARETLQTSLGRVGKERILKVLAKELESKSVEFNEESLLEEVLQSGLVTEDSGKLAFFHAAFRDLFAGKSLLERLASGEDINEYLLKVEWEEAVVFAAGLVDSPVTQKKFMDTILENDLYLYIRCVKSSAEFEYDKNLSDEGLAREFLTALLDAYTRIINRWFPHVAHAMGPFDSEGRLAIVGRTSRDTSIWITYFFTPLASSCQPVKLIPASHMVDLQTLGLSLGARRFVARKLEKLSRTLPHSLAIEEVWDAMSTILKAQALDAPRLLLQEYVWAGLKRLTRDKVLSKEEAANLDTARQALLQRYGQSLMQGATVSYGAYDTINLGRLIDTIDKLVQQGETQTVPLLPEPDRYLPNGGWITQMYEDGTLKRYIEQYFSVVHNGYREIVVANLPEIGTRMPFYQLLPAKVTAQVVRPAPSKDIESLGGCEYYLWPVQTAGETSVTVEVSEVFKTRDSLIRETSFESRANELIRLGRPQGAYAPLFHGRSLGGFFRGDLPVTQAIYAQLEEDLKHVFGKR